MSTILGAIVFDLSVGESVSGDEKLINDIGRFGDCSGESLYIVPPVLDAGAGGGGLAGRLFSMGSVSGVTSSVNNSRATITELATEF